MQVPRGDRGNAGEATHRARYGVARGELGLRAVAQLAPVVGPPTPDDAIARDREAVAPARGDRADVRDAGNAYRHQLAFVIAELEAVILSPRPDRAIALERERVAVPRGNRDDASEAFDRRGSRAIGGRAVAELAEAVDAPRPHRAVAQERHDVILSRAHPRDVREAEHDRGRRGDERPAKSELSGGIVAPGAHGAVGMERHAVVVAGAHRRRRPVRQQRGERQAGAEERSAQEHRPILGLSARAFNLLLPPRECRVFRGIGRNRGARQGRRASARAPGGRVARK